MALVLLTEGRWCICQEATEQDQKVKVRDPEEGKAVVNPEKAARDPAQIPVPDQGKDRAGKGAEVEAPVKAGIEVKLEKNNRSHLKKVFSSDIGVEPSSQTLDILEYACGLILGLALISN